MPRQKHPSPLAMGYVREEARIELIRCGYICRPWGRAKVRFYPHSRRIDICNLVIEPVHRNQGFGTAIVDVIKAHAAVDSYMVWALIVLEDAEGFWRRQGFTPDTTATFNSDWVWRPMQ